MMWNQTHLRYWLGLDASNWDAKWLIISALETSTDNKGLLYMDSIQYPFKKLSLQLKKYIYEKKN